MMRPGTKPLWTRCIAFSPAAVAIMFGVADVAHAAISGTKVEGWRIAEVGEECAMISAFNAPGDPYFAVAYETRRKLVTLVLDSKNWSSIVEGKNYAIIFEWPDGSRVKISGIGQQTNPERKGFVTQFSDESFLLDLAKHRYVDIYRDDTRIFNLKLDGSSKAALAMIRCSNDLFMKSNADPFSDAQRMRTPQSKDRPATARNDPSTWISADDFHRKDKVLQVAGRKTVVKYIVGRDGRLRNCSVIESSGDQDLDTQVCMLLVRRGRYQPAMNEAGDTIETTDNRTIKWGQQ